MLTDLERLVVSFVTAKEVVHCQYFDDPELAERMGEAARVRAEREFSSTKSVEQYLDLYRRTIRDCPD